MSLNQTTKCKVNTMSKLSIKAKTIMALVASTNGAIFSVVHKRKKPVKCKETGLMLEYSAMSCRTGVTCDLKGGKSTIAAKKNDGLIGVTKMNDKKSGTANYRCFYADSVKSITVQGIIYTFDDKD